MRHRLGVVILGLCLAVIVPPSQTLEATSGQLSRRHSEVLILGDSILSLVGHVKEAIDKLRSRRTIIFAARPCQRLLAPGCVHSSPASAYEIYRANRYRVTDAVVVATGYNDIGDEVLEEALHRFCDLSGQLGHRLIWVNYSERGDVLGKALHFNRILRAFKAQHSGFDIADWNSVATSRDRNFSADGVHLSRSGAILAARLIDTVLSRGVRGQCAVAPEH